MEKNVPKLRFPEFEGEWIVSKLGSKTNISSGGTPSTTKEEFWGGSIKWMNSGELNLKRVYDVENRITEIGLKHSSTKLIPRNCILIGLAGQGKTRGTVAMNMIELCTNQSIAAIYPNLKEFDSNFLYYNLDNRYEELRGLSTGDGGRGGLNLQIIKSLIVFLPETKEQTKIANFLTSVDAKISHLKKKKELLEKYKKGVMQKIFTQKIRFKDENGNDYPEWEYLTLGDITFKVGKKNKNNIQYPIYSINNKSGFVPQSEQFEGMDSNQRGYDITLYKIIEKNTFAYNPARINVGSLGYSGNLNNIIISSLYVCFKTIDKVNDKFLHQYFNTPKFNFMVNSFTEGGVRQYLFYENFSNISLNLPSKTEQTKISNFLSAIDDKINQCSKQIEGMETWKKGLLQKMFV